MIHKCCNSFRIDSASMLRYDFINGSNYRQYFFVTIQSHAKLRSANACIQADKQFYMAK